MENNEMTRSELIVFLKSIAENIRLKAKDGNEAADIIIDMIKELKQNDQRNEPSASKHQLAAESPNPIKGQWNLPSTRPLILAQRQEEIKGGNTHGRYVQICLGTAGGQHGQREREGIPASLENRNRPPHGRRDGGRILFWGGFGMMTHDEIKADILQYLSEEYWYCKDKNGCFNVELYADYRDELCESSINEILQADDPYAAFYEKMDEMYMEEEWHLFDEEFDKIKRRYDIPEECEDDARDILEAYLDFYAPADHFLAQDVYVDIMMDTGDGNYDYVLNSVYPCWYGQEKERIDDKSSLLWLAKQQGYTKTQLWRALLDGDVSEPNGFLESCRQEVANIVSHMNTLTFLVKMPLRDAIKLNQMVKLQDRNGHFWDATKNPYCGYLILDKSVMCGLYDPWHGGGSVLEIQCEKDVRIPVRFIRSALPDGADGYSIESVYGMCGSAWRECLKETHVPSKFKKEIA